MSYDPPSETNWVYLHHFLDVYAVAYREGWAAAMTGKSLDDNPYMPSGRSRTASPDGELDYWWYSGHQAYEPKEKV